MTGMIHISSPQLAPCGHENYSLCRKNERFRSCNIICATRLFIQYALRLSQMYSGVI